MLFHGTFPAGALCGLDKDEPPVAQLQKII